jgi:pimeloyl-ACP methyl ester carboxylesterase
MPVAIVPISTGIPWSRGRIIRAGTIDGDSGLEVLPMPEFSRAAVTISYTDEGSGQPVVLLHGHTLDRRVWNPIVGELHAAGLRVLRPDLRGHGRSTRPNSGYHVSHHAADMVALLDTAGLERAAIIGFSFGGGVVLEMAVSHAPRVAALGLVAPLMPDRPFEPAFMANLREVAGMIRTQGIEAAMAGPWATSPLFNHSFTKAGVREAVATMVKDFPGAEFLATERDRVDRDWTIPERLGGITAPTRVLVGENEMPGFKAFAEEAAEGIPGATLEVVPDCGHLLPLEAPDAVAEMILGLVS